MPLLLAFVYKERCQKLPHYPSHFGQPHLNPLKIHYLGQKDGYVGIGLSRTLNHYLKKSKTPLLPHIFRQCAI